MKMTSSSSLDDIPPNQKPEVSFQKYAIILNEAKPEIGKQQQQHRVPPSTKETTPSTLVKELLPKKLEDKCQNLEQHAKALVEKIRVHAGVEASVFSGDEIIQENGPGLAPLMFRMAVEHFAKNCTSHFKIIQCRYETKLSSDWKPSLPDILIDRKHQVIVVDLKECFLSPNTFAYAILRQINNEWKQKLPQTLFYPNDVCTRKEDSPEKYLIRVTPSMPDGDFKLSKTASHRQRELLKMFKRICMNALKNTLTMEDLGIGNSDEIVAAFARIRTIYRRVQRRLFLQSELLIPPESCLGLIRQMESIVKGDLATAGTVMDIGGRLFDLGNLPELPEISGDCPLSESAVISMMDMDGGGDRLLSDSNGKFFSSMVPANSKKVKGRPNVGGQISFTQLAERFSRLDKNLTTQFQRIHSMLGRTRK